MPQTVVSITLLVHRISQLKNRKFVQLVTSWTVSYELFNNSLVYKFILLAFQDLYNLANQTVILNITVVLYFSDIQKVSNYVAIHI